MLRARVEYQHLVRTYIHDYTRADIETIIGVLFDPASRAQLAADLRRETDVVTADALTRYYSHCAAASVRPCAMARHQLYVLHTDRMLRLTAGAEALMLPQMLRRYSAFVYELWRIAVESPTFAKNYHQLRLVQHTVSALYMLCGRFAVASADGVDAAVIVDTDAFLDAHLPAEKLLRRWNAQVHRPLQSLPRVLSTTVTRAGYIEFNMTGISFGRKMIKLALQEAAADPVYRAEITERLRAAYTSGRVANETPLLLSHTNK
jgi:hypothetical protein